MNDSKASEALQASLDTVTGVVMRHGPDAETRTFVAMATHLGDGAWATMDAVYGGRIYEQYAGTHEIIDLWIHPVNGGEFPVRWGHKAIMKPLAILYAPGSGRGTPERVGAAEVAHPEYAKVWRNSFGGARVFADLEFDPSTTTVGVEGCVFHLPSFSRWDAEREDHTPAVLAGMDYPCRKDAGGPIMTPDGRLAGMLLGPDYGPGGDHKGWYMPIDYIAPSLEMAREGVPHARGRHGASIDHASHRSHDVEFGEAA